MCDTQTQQSGACVPLLLLVVVVAAVCMFTLERGVQARPAVLVAEVPVRFPCGKYLFFSLSVCVFLLFLLFCCLFFLFLCFLSSIHSGVPFVVLLYKHL